MNKVLFSSNYDSWRTPQDLFNKLDKEFNFTIDSCASEDNKLCDRYYCIENSFLNNFPCDEVIFCNPPYSRGLGKFIKHCNDLRYYGNTIVLLVPSRTDTLWFHEYIYNRVGVEIRFVKGRLHFYDGKNKNDSAPFPSMIVIMNSL